MLGVKGLDSRFRATYREDALLKGGLPIGPERVDDALPALQQRPQPAHPLSPVPVSGQLTHLEILSFIFFILITTIIIIIIIITTYH